MTEQDARDRMRHKKMNCFVSEREHTVKKIRKNAVQSTV